MMHGREKSDPAIVAGKPTNKAGATAAEPVEPRVGAKGNVDQQSTYRTQGRDTRHRRWNAYGKQQDNGRRRSSPRSSTTSASTCSGNRSSRSAFAATWTVPTRRLCQASRRLDRPARGLRCVGSCRMRCVPSR